MADKTTTVFISKINSLRVKTSTGWVKFSNGRATVTATQAKELKAGRGFGVDFHEETAATDSGEN